MATIPAKDIVTVVPGVLPAGGSALDMIGLLLTLNTRAPIGQVVAFANADDVGSYFGPSSTEKALAENYFLGFDNSHKKPGSILFAQYPQGAVDAYIRGGSVAGLSLAQLQAINGQLAITVDGYPRTVANVNLTAATSFSAAATLLQTALNAGGANPNVASVTGSVAASTSAFTATIVGYIMTVTGVSSGVLVAGTTISGAGVSAGTLITGQLSGVTGGIGVYTVSILQNVATAVSIAGTYGTMTVTAVSSGTLSVGQTLTGSGITAGTQITQLGTGTGLTGTYFVSSNTVVSSTSITAAGANVSVTYDSISGGFVITSGALMGSVSSIAYASGPAGISLALTLATGATLSQGSAGLTPDAFMSSITAITQDWVSVMTVFDPDNGVQVNTQKQAFAAWVNAQGNQYAYVCWDIDVTPTTVQPDPTSLGDLLDNSDSSGTVLIWAPDTTQGPIKAAFVCGAAASIDFTQRNGRITFAFRSQTGLFADVTNQTIAHNLGGDPQSIGSKGNFYNFYGAYATRNDQFVWFNRGFVSGPFLWADSYYNQIWLNNALQLALMVLLKSAYSIPYNSQGYAMIEAACLDPIIAALNFGAIRAGITLSQSQISQVNTSAGLDIATVIQQRGWYLQISDASPQVRAARASPPCTLWYTDGQSVQAINLASIEVQ